jgi:hypothetical protein
MLLTINTLASLKRVFLLSFFTIVFYKNEVHDKNLTNSCQVYEGKMREKSPLDDLKPLLKVLDSIKKREKTHWSDIWSAYNSSNEKDSWGSFIEITKQRYETILELVLIVAANKASLKKIEEWTENFETLLTEDEQALIERVKFLLLKGEDFLTSLKNRSSVEENITYEVVVNKVKAKIKLEIEQMLEDIDKLSSD